jgi:hypothetical protein
MTSGDGDAMNRITDHGWQHLLKCKDAVNGLVRGVRVVLEGMFQKRFTELGLGDSAAD